MANPTHIVCKLENTFSGESRLCLVPLGQVLVSIAKETILLAAALAFFTAKISKDRLLTA